MQAPDELRDIAAEIASVILDIRYATANNFTGQQLYVHQLAWLRPQPLEALAKAGHELAEQGLRLVIFDAYRPPSVQKKLRKFCQDDKYVAEISNHCRGITVDLSLADANGSYLDMGTDYDDFSPKAHSGTTLISSQQQANRRLLAEVMQKNGFAEHAYEWWHFDYRPDLEWNLVEDELNTFQP